MSLRIAFNYLVDTLRRVSTLKAMRVLDEGAVLVTLSPLGFDENIVIYLLAGELSPEFVKKVVNANTRADKHTLLIVSDEFLPPDRTVCQPDKGLRLLLDLYGGKVYAYSVAAQQVRIFPVYIGGDWNVTYGQPVNVADLSSDYAVIHSNYIWGVRNVAGFEARQFRQSRRSSTPRSNDPLQPFYDLLDVPNTASVSEVKKAYRQKAHQHHPDRDASPDATARMQRINEAYEQIMKRFE